MAMPNTIQGQTLKVAGRNIALRNSAEPNATSAPRQARYGFYSQTRHDGVDMAGLTPRRRARDGARACVPGKSRTPSRAMPVALEAPSTRSWKTLFYEDLLMADEYALSARPQTPAARAGRAVPPSASP